MNVRADETCGSAQSVAVIYCMETVVITCRRMPFSGVPAALSKHMTQLDTAPIPHQGRMEQSLCEAGQHKYLYICNILVLSAVLPVL
jgi:hypothetical protein